MDGQQYLDQISEATRPVQTSKTPEGAGKLLSSKFFIVGIVGLVGLILIIILGAILGGGNKGGEKSLGYALKLHLEGTISAIEEYQPNLKSSILRSYSASLRGILSSTQSELDGYLTAKYKVKEKEIDESILKHAAESKENLLNELFESKINGMLDGVFASKMTHETATLINEEAQLIKKSKNAELTESLTRSRDSLLNLYDKFNDFSETNN